MSSPTYSWVTHGSPLWHRDKVQSTVKPLPSIDDRKKLEKGFVNDAVKTRIEHYSKRRPIIPPYDAVRDKYAQAYFQSPLVRAVMDRTISLEQLKQEKRQLLHERRHMRTLNKLSNRRRCKQTPTIEELKKREGMFRNDAIKTETQRTKYKDIIPRYDATKDNHCQKYFTRPDVQRLVSVTCSPRDSVTDQDKYSPTQTSFRSAMA